MNHYAFKSLSPYRLQTVIVIAISLTLIYLAAGLSEFLLEEHKSIFGDWYIIQILSEYGTSVATSILLFFLCTSIIGVSFKWFWVTYIDPPLNEYKKVIISEIEKNKKSLEDSLKVFRQESEELLKDNLLESVVARSDSKYLKKNLKLIHERAYGSHCGNDRGLHAAIRNELYPFLMADRPHRSQHNQNITVTIENGVAKWTEITRFELHAIALDEEYSTQDTELKHLCVDEDSTPEVTVLTNQHATSAKAQPFINHNLEMSTGGQFVNLEQMSLEIQVEGKLVASLQDMIELDRQNKSVSVKDEYANKLRVDSNAAGYIAFALKIPIRLEKAMTRVQIIEKSFLDDNDNFYVVRRVEPSYGAVISITLPDKWNILSFTVPNEAKWGFPNSLIAKSNPCHNVVADINGWVMPGIIAACTWERN